VDGSRILIGKSPAHVINRTLRLAGSPLLVAVGYYIGTRVGFLMTPSGEPNSTFWPANAILLAAFLLAPRRVWWTFVLAVLPAHMLAQVQSGVPVWTQLGWFISNSAEALIGAYCITRFSREERRFETVRGVLVFILFGVLVSPFVTSFLDAAVVVVTGWGHSYWPLGAERFWTNALAELTVVPVVVLGGLNGIRWIRNVDSVHRREAVLLGTVTILAALCVFGFRSASAVTLPAVLYLPLPLLLWAAVRFRLGGLSLSVLCMALISMWYTMHGRLPFPYASMRQNILSLQVLFCVVGVPLMFLSALMDETQGVQESLQNVNAELIRQAAVIESSHDAIASGTLDGIIVSWNAGAERLYGYTEAEAIGKPITMLVPPELPDEEQRILDTLRTGGQIEHFETVRVTKAGKKINVSLTISPIKDSTGKTVGISGIARDITGQKRAEEALRASEERLRLAQWAARIGTFDLNLRTGVDIWTPETEALYGLPPGGFGGTQTAFENLIHPDDRERIAALTQEMIRTGQPVEEEWRVVWPDGSVHWVAGRGQAVIDESGEPARLLGVNLDVTERKQAAEALSVMTRKLIEAQEQERARIGRELHDDINQRLAMLAVELEQLQNDPSLVQQRVSDLRKQTAEISNDVQALSHDLHSSKLEYLGVVAGIKSWCKEFSKRQGMEVDFKSDAHGVLPVEVGRTLLRVLQEALHNASKHSGARRAAVQLEATPGEIHMIVRDLGRGFNVEAALQGTGLGLISMRERVRLVNGTITIDSEPMRGTSIHVRVPIPSEQDSERAAG